ncbi:MAG: hypothetical protein N3D84_01750 [Candidatus Woesearchaeota archaeon]|nr:hypothetical protein [Candidatus Woesearchaeota archaeon]
MVTLTFEQQVAVSVIGIILFLIIAKKLLTKNDKEFEKMYSEILLSEKYKVKGRFEE